MMFKKNKKQNPFNLYKIKKQIWLFKSIFIELFLKLGRVNFKYLLFFKVVYIYF